MEFCNEVLAGTGLAVSLRCGVAKEDGKVQNITFYKPQEGCDLAVLIRDSGRNASAFYAKELHELWKEVQRAAGKSRITFIPNITYTFPSRLVFRLFDDGLQSDREVLEFWSECRAPEAAKSKVLSTIPRHLLSIGVLHGTVESLVAFIEAEWPS